MKVLSLFDGMGCGMIALRELGIELEVYYASEVDKHAIKHTMLNFPEIIHLGDVKQIDVSKLGKIDLLIGGSPCQSFSFAGKMNGMSTKNNEEVTTFDRYLELKEQNYEFEGESYLFWEYIRILNDIREYNPSVLFLLENVKMSKKWEKVIDKAIGVHGVHINSALVSAQNRRRIYWTNIRTRKYGLFGELHSDIPQPVDKGILLKDILDDEVDEKYYATSKRLEFITNEFRLKKKYTQINSKNKSLPLLARAYSNWTGDYICENTGRIRQLTPTECCRLQTIPDWYKWYCSDTQIYKMLGNGWTVEVIKHIFSFIKNKK